MALIISIRFCHKIFKKNYSIKYKLYFNWKTLLIAIRKISEIDRRVWAMLALTPWVAVQHIGLFHRDKTRVLMPAKMFPHLKLLCWQFLGPTFGFDTKQRNSFFDQIWCVFYNKGKILTILFIVKYEKIAL